MWSEAGLEWLHKIRTVQVVSAAVGVRAWNECACGLKLAWSGCIR